MVKRISALILAVIISTAAVGSNVYASKNIFTDISDSEYAEEIEFLQDIGLISGYEDGSFKPNEYVARCEFAAIIIRVMGLGNAEALSDRKQIFNDVDSNHWAAGFVNAAYVLGIVNGVGENNFEPEGNVTFNQATKMILSAFDYAPYVEEKGGYPTGFIMLGNSVGLFKDLKIEERNLTRGEVSCMIYNALAVDTLKFGTGEKSGRTVLEDVLGFTKHEGVLQAVAGSYANAGEALLKENEIIIDGKCMTIRCAKPTEYVGMRVTYYVKEYNGKETVFHVTESQESDRIVIEASQIDDETTPQKFIYWENNKKKTIIPQDDFFVIYNGKKASTGDMENGVLIPQNGYVAFVDIDDDGGWNFAVVYEYQSIYVKSIYENTIYGAFGNKIELPYSDQGSVVLYKNKDLISIEEIPTGSVLNVAVSKDGTVVSGTVTDEKIEGEITGISQDDGKTVYTVETDSRSIDAELCFEYEQALAQNRSDAIKLELRTNVVLLLNEYGKIAYAEAKGETVSKNYAYITSGAWNKSSIDGGYSFKLLMPDNTFKIFDTAKNGKIMFGRTENGSYTISSANVQTVVNYLKKGKSEWTYENRQIITYELNSDGEIKEICTADSKLSYDHLWGSGVINTYTYLNGSFNQVYYVDEDTVVFSVPNSGKYSEQFSAGIYLDYFNNRKEYKVYLYDIHDGHVGAVLYSDDKERFTSMSVGYKVVIDKVNSPVMLVQSVENVIATDESHCMQLTGYIDGEEQSVLVADALQGNSDPKNELKSGMIIQFETNYDELGKAETEGELEKIVVYKKIMDCVEDNSYFERWDYNTMKVLTPSIYFGFGNVQRAEMQEMRLQAAFDTASRPFRLNYGTQVFSFNKVQKKFQKKSFLDISEGQDIFIRHRYGSVREIVIIEK